MTLLKFWHRRTETPREIEREHAKSSALSNSCMMWFRTSASILLASLLTAPAFGIAADGDSSGAIAEREVHEVEQPLAHEIIKTWNFDGDAAGEIANGFATEVGKWVVVKSDQGNALMQTAKNPNSTFNVALIADANAKEVDISVKLKAIAGEVDQGGGIVWRAKDAQNYYLARYNPLEDNYRLYKVIDGKRTMFLNADIVHTDGWHTLRVTMSGNRIECYYDGKKYMEHKDETLLDAGKIGLWSKADAQTQFDALTLIGK